MNKGSQEDIQSAVGRTIERVARESYGRLVAYLSVHTHDGASGSSARRQKSAMVVSSLKFRNSAICRSGSMPCWKLSTLPSESAGTTCLALTRVAAILQRKPSGLRGFFCSSCPARLRFKACWLSCCTVNHGARHAGHLMADTFLFQSRTRSNGHFL